MQAAIEEVGGLLGADEDRAAGGRRRASSPAPTSCGPTSRRSRRGWSPIRSPTLMYAAASNGGYVTYVSALQQQITLRGARRSPAPAGSAPTCCRPGASTPDPLAGRSRRHAGRRGCGGSTSCPAEGPQGQIVDLRLHLRAGGAGGDDHPAAALPGRADQRDLRRPDRPVREPALRRFVAAPSGAACSGSGRRWTCSTCRSC